MRACSGLTVQTLRQLPGTRGRWASETTLDLAQSQQAAGFTP